MGDLCGRLLWQGAWCSSELSLHNTCVSARTEKRLGGVLLCLCYSVSKPVSAMVPSPQKTPDLSRHITPYSWAREAVKCVCKSNCHLVQTEIETEEAHGRARRVEVQRGRLLRCRSPLMSPMSPAPQDQAYSSAIVESSAWLSSMCEVGAKKKLTAWGRLFHCLCLGLICRSAGLH